MVHRSVGTLGVVSLACAAALGLSACGGTPTGADEAPLAVADHRDGRVRVVTTVAPLTSLVAGVVGDRAEVTGVVPEGTNSHTFEPAPSVAKVLSAADVIFVNGLRLEDPTRKLADDNRKAGARLVALGDEVLPKDEYVYDFSFPKEEGKPNPHVWTDPTYARRYAEVVRDTMVEVDAANADAYEANFAAFAAQVDAFDGAMRTAFATVPRDQRKLLTYHDAYAYFARTYDWTVVGAIQVESFDDPTAKEVAHLIRQVEDEGVRAVFGSEVFPSPVLEAIGREAGVTYVDVLRDDDLPGEPGKAEHSWLGLMRFDFATIVEALGGDAEALEEFDVRGAVRDEAVYPQ
jgi:ABC-type Zn uptake system ZnuABC Zn-binding protein ZnuA